MQVDLLHVANLALHANVLLNLPLKLDADLNLAVYLPGLQAFVNLDLLPLDLKANVVLGLLKCLGVPTVSLLANVND